MLAKVHGANLVSTFLTAFRPTIKSTWLIRKWIMWQADIRPRVYSAVFCQGRTVEFLYNLLMRGVDVSTPVHDKHSPWARLACLLCKYKLLFDRDPASLVAFYYANYLIHLSNSSSLVSLISIHLSFHSKTNARGCLTLFACHYMGHSPYKRKTDFSYKRFSNSSH